MSERKSWKTDEDQILKLLHEQRGMTKWNQIAIVMKQQFGIVGRNGKQCRERYHNHLDTQINKGQWSLQEQKQLMLLHNQQGNKWAEIAKKLPGRTDNCVKNKYYSKLRKGIKILNQHISQYFKKKFKLLKPEIIYKILEISDEKYKTHTQHQKETIQTAFNLKNRLLISSDIDLTNDQKELLKIQEFISELNIFNKKNRRKGKKRVQVVESDHEDDSEISFQEINHHGQINEQIHKNQAMTMHTAKRITRLKQKKQQSENFSVSINEEMSPQFKEQYHEAFEQEEYIHVNKDLKMISLMSMQDKQEEGEKTIKTTTMSNIDFQIDFQRVLMNDLSECMQQFLRKDFYGYQQI